MNTYSKQSLVLGAAVAAVALIGSASAADYGFKPVTADGKVQTIQLVDTATGKSVDGADIVVVHTFYGPHQNGAANVQRVFVPLKDHLAGNCAHPASDWPSGDQLTLMGKVSGEFWPVWQTIKISE